MCLKKAFNYFKQIGLFDLLIYCSKLGLKVFGNFLVVLV